MIRMTCNFTCNLACRIDLSASGATLLREETSGRPVMKRRLLFAILLAIVLALILKYGVNAAPLAG